MNGFRPKGGADFQSGALLIAIAAVALWQLRPLEMGTLRQMGPGYLPTFVCVALVLLGVALVVRGMTVKGTPALRLEWRPLVLICASFVAFALLLENAGLLAAIVMQILVASFASRESVLWQTAIFGTFLTLGSVALFIWLLSIPVKLLP